MEIELRQISVDDTESFRAAVDAVAREHKYIALLEAPPIEQVRNFLKRNIECGYPQIIAVREGAAWMVQNTTRQSSRFRSCRRPLYGPCTEWRGRALGERLLRHAVYTADTFGFQRIELGVFATNDIAAAHYQKVGFVKEGTKRKAILIDGIHHDEILMARLKPSFEGGSLDAPRLNCWMARLHDPPHAFLLMVRFG